MKTYALSGRRGFINSAGRIITAASAATMIGRTWAAEEKEDEGEEDVSPAEDLMREHGLLKRVLLIYGESIRRMEKGEDLPPSAVAESAKIIRSFIEDYHEKLEENFLFPRFEKAGKLVELVETLRVQHQGGRRLTDITLGLANAKSLKVADERNKLADSLKQFIRMYEPHEAREDTILFPAFRQIVSKHEYDSLGEDFEKKEHELFGKEGFEGMVDKVAEIEKTLGIHDLSLFTPKF
ncbi:MAG: hemerythrin domain-containing protein [Verrucomicrobia bacterium]|nr:hemerythrin domain-containing protein [Verrucomicrobiota bacterium]